MGTFVEGLAEVKKYKGERLADKEERGIIRKQEEEKQRGNRLIEEGKIVIEGMGV